MSMDSTLPRRMTTEREVSPERTFVRTRLPWLVAAGALVVYLVTLNRWVSLSSLRQVAMVSGWTWQPEFSGPLFLLLTYPFRWLPAHLIPLALNLFAAVCASLSLALLARSVVLLPHDRTHEQRHQEIGRSGLLAIRSAWLPPVLAALVCGLQLTFWEHATALASAWPPQGSGCEMLDLLLFAYVVRCLLEFRVEEEESWLMRAAFACGIGMTNNWAMIGFFPAFVVAVVWIKGLGFFNLRFLGRISICGLVGLMLYLLLPLLHAVANTSVATFWIALKANVNAQMRMLSAFYHPPGRQTVELLSLTSLLPVFFIGIRWSSRSGDVNKLAIALTTVMFRVVHALFLVACIWVALDPPFSPRNRGGGSPFLPFYYLGALTIGYCSAYFLLLFRRRSGSRRRQPTTAPLLNRVVTGAIWLLLFVTPLALICRNLPQIRTTNGPMLKRFSALMAKALPSDHAVVLSDDPTRSLLLQAFTAQSGKGKDILIVDTAELPWPQYHRFLKRKHPSVWTSDPPASIAQKAEPLLLASVITLLAQSNSVYYLHPSFGYYFELFYPEPHGLVYRLNPYPTNALFAPPVSKDLIAENDAFWAEADNQTLQPLVAILASANPGKSPGLWDRLMERAHLAKEVNSDATVLAAFYSRALNYWGVEMQKSGRLTNAASYFERARELKPDNLVAQINLKCNEELRLSGQASVPVPKSIEDEFGKYRNWDEVVSANGPFDEPNFCFEEGQTLVGSSLFRQAAAQFDRAQTMSPTNVVARLRLGQLYIIGRMPDEALKLVERIRAKPDLLAAARNNRVELLLVEASAHLAKGDVGGADAAVAASVRQNPGEESLLATATQAYMNYGCFSNALITIDQQLALAPTNVTTLVNKGYACLHIGAYEQAIAPLTQALSLESTNYSALLNRAIAYLRADKLDAAQQDYEVLRQAFPNAFQIYYGLAEVAWQRKDTNAAIGNYELYLAHAPTNTTEANLVSARLKELRPGSP